MGVRWSSVGRIGYPCPLANRTLDQGASHAQPSPDFNPVREYGNSRDVVGY